MPPRGPGWDRRRACGACARWAITLVEPLLPIRRQEGLDARLVEAAAADPELVALWFAGVTSDVARTLPSDDAWRTVVREDAASGVRTAPDRSGTRAGKVPPAQVLSEAPEVAQAPCWPSGESFGTWRDGTDLVELVWGSPELDPGLVPLADGLSPRGARVLVASLAGWRCAWVEAKHLVEAAGKLQPVHDLADALRWACWRRRAYGIPPAEDVWPYESAHNWARRAFELLEDGTEPDEAEIERDVRWHRIGEQGA